MTPADLLHLPDGERHLELIDGRVRDRVKGMAAALTAGHLLAAVSEHADRRGHRVFGWSLGYDCFPDDPNAVRRASVTVITADRMPADLIDADPAFLPVPPDFVADAVGPTATPADEAADAAAWLAAGARHVWMADTVRRCVRSYAIDGAVTLHATDDTLTADDILPGFAVPVAALFRKPGDPPA